MGKKRCVKEKKKKQRRQLTTRHKLLLWTLPYKGRIIIGPRVVTDQHVTDRDHLDHLDHYDHQDSGKRHVYNDAPFRQNRTLVVDSHSNLSYRHC